MTKLEKTVRDRLRKIGARKEDIQAIFSFLKPLGEKGSAGVLHRNHSLRVGLLAADIAKHLGLDERALLFAGLVHDVGKALVPTCTLGRTDAWTSTDQALMEAHVLDGFRMLRDRLDFTAQVIVQHHRFQGSRSYPKELPPAPAPFSQETLDKAKHYAQILALADVFDALHRVNSSSGGKALSSAEIHEKMFQFHPADVHLIAELYDAGIFS